MTTPSAVEQARERKPEFEFETRHEGDKVVYQMVWNLNLTYLGNGKFVSHPPIERQPEGTTP